MENKLVISQATNTLIKGKHIAYGERLDYLVNPYQYNVMWIDSIGLHCFDHLDINCRCIEDGVKYLEDCAFENAYVFNDKLPIGMKIGERCFTNSQLIDILLPRDLHIIERDFLKL